MAVETEPTSLKEFSDNLRESIGYACIQHGETHKELSKPVLTESSPNFQALKHLLEISATIQKELNMLVKWAKAAVIEGSLPTEADKQIVLNLGYQVRRSLATDLAEQYDQMYENTDVFADTTIMKYNIDLTVLFVEKFIKVIKLAN